MDDVIVVDGLGSGSWRYAGFPVAVQPAAHQADDLAGSSAWASMSMPEKKLYVFSKIPFPELRRPNADKNQRAQWHSKIPLARLI
jgi:hypothetical protein